MGIFQLPNLCSTSQRTSCCASAVKSLIKIHPQNARRLLRKRPHGAVATYQPPYHQLYKYTQRNHGALTPSLPLLLLRRHPTPFCSPTSTTSTSSSQITFPPSAT